jgi:hypothetical protein
MECIIDNTWEDVGFAFHSVGYEEVCDIMQCSPLKVTDVSEERVLLHPQGRWISQARNQREARNKQAERFLFLAGCFTHTHLGALPPSAEVKNGVAIPGYTSTTSTATRVFVAWCLINYTQWCFLFAIYIYIYVYRYNGDLLVGACSTLLSQEMSERTLVISFWHLVVSLVTYLNLTVVL